MTTQSGNTAVGRGAGFNAATSGLTYLGFQAGYNTSTGYDNVAVGVNALFSNTTGNENVAIGYRALIANTTASDNTAVGNGALDSATTGGTNTSVGRNSLADCTTGSGNVAVGNDASENLTTGVNNICIGIDCADTLTTGDSNIFIGNTARGSSSSASNQISMGVVVSCVGDNNFTFGNQSTDSNIAFGATSITAPSDIRLKEDIQDEKVGLDFINDLRPVTFQWKKEKDIPSEMRAYKEGSEERTMNGKYNHGFIAQEVKEVIDNHNLKDGFDMWQEDEADGRQRVAPNAIMSVMVKAVQELSTQVDELKAEIQTLKGE